MVLFIPFLMWPMLFAIIIVWYFVYMCWYYRTFSRQNIPVDGTPIPWFGTMFPMLKIGFIEGMKGHLQKFGKTYGSYGARMPVLVTIDFDIIRSVYIKDTETFATRNKFKSGDPMSDDMLNNITDYEKWKTVRSVMSPTFSSGKLKRMVPAISKCAQRMLKNLEKSVKEGKSVEMKETAGFYTTDTIATTAFGINLDSKQDENGDFVKYAKMALDINMKHPIMIIIFFFPFLIPMLPYMKLRIFKKEMTDFFAGVTNQIIETRKDDDDQRVDFLRLMLDAQKENTDGEAKLTHDELVIQCIMFFIAGYESTATAIAFTMHNLTLNPDAQDKLVEEIEQVRLNHCDSNIIDDRNGNADDDSRNP